MRAVERLDLWLDRILALTEPLNYPTATNFWQVGQAMGFPLALKADNDEPG